MKKIINSSYFIVTFFLLIVYSVMFLITGNGLPCIFHKITGFYCPGCGISRMFISFAKLDFYQAFRYNPLVFILLILFFIYMIIEIIHFKKKRYYFKINKWLYVVLLVIVISFGILRNIPYFSFLAPTVVN